MCSRRSSSCSYKVGPAEVESDTDVAAKTEENGAEAAATVTVKSYHSYS